MESIKRRYDIVSEVDEALSGMAKAASAFIRGANGGVQIPNNKEVIRILEALQQAMFPSYFGGCGTKSRETLLYEVYGILKQQITLAQILCCREEDACMDPEYVCSAFVAALPKVYALLLKDIEALYEGDPAAKSREEVLIAYPGFFAISIYRIAHELYKLRVPLIPRMMTEYAHERTGIDIHAGATIGEYFFIDHGTGTVVGETTIIGDHVKLYQGVTLGAKSFPVDESGCPVKELKRHPHLEDRVIIYANATILGGDTVIGEGAVIGGSVWLTHSVPPNSIVYYEK